MNRRGDIWEDIKRLQDTLSYASSKVDYSVGENVYMLPSNMTLKIKTGTVGYNNKILVFNGNFSLGKNDKVNSLETPVMKNHKTDSLEPTTIKSLSNTTQGLDPGGTPLHRTHAPTISHEDEKTALILFITGGFTVWLISVLMKV